MGSESAKRYTMKMPTLKPLKLIPVMIGVLVLVGCSNQTGINTNVGSDTSGSTNTDSTIVENTDGNDTTNALVNSEKLSTYSIDEFGYTITVPSNFSIEDQYAAAVLRIKSDKDGMFTLNIHDPNINAYDIDKLMLALGDESVIVESVDGWSIVAGLIQDNVSLWGVQVANGRAYILSSRSVYSDENYNYDIVELNKGEGLIKNFQMTSNLQGQYDSLVTLIHNSIITEGTLNTTPEQGTLDERGRALLSEKLLGRYHEYGPLNCDADFNFDDANEFVKYNNETYNISFDVPYNSAWGNQMFWIEPYTGMDKSISFGPLSSFEACSWLRWYNFEITDSRRPSDIKNALSELDSYQEYTVGNHEVVEYTQLGMCDPHYYEVIGERNNYLFKPVCGEIENIEQIIGSFEIE